MRFCEAGNFPPHYVRVINFSKDNFGELLKNFPQNKILILYDYVIEHLWVNLMTKLANIVITLSSSIFNRRRVSMQIGGIKDQLWLSIGFRFFSGRHAIRQKATFSFIMP